MPDLQSPPCRKRRRDGALFQSAGWAVLLLTYSLRVSAFCSQGSCNGHFMNTHRKYFHPTGSVLLKSRKQQKLFFSSELEAKLPLADSDSSLSMEHVWIWQDETWIPRNDSNSRMDPSSAKTAKTLVQNWCEKFVLKLDLCPWARASLQTPGAMRFFLVPPSDSISSESKQRQHMETIVASVTERFQIEILTPTTECNDGDESPSAILEKAAIYFVVFLPNENEAATMLPESFFDFIDWFTELEEDWPEEYDNVIVAPFHPSWEFGGMDDDPCLDYEKRSPYPLVTLVSTDVMEKAGATVTEAIGEHNREVLLNIEEESISSTLNASVGELWLSAVYGKNKAQF